jgi:hypothetical protein
MKAQNISELVKERLAMLKGYESFDLEEKQADLDKAKVKLATAQKAVDTLTAEITGYKGMALS